MASQVAKPGEKGKGKYRFEQLFAKPENPERRTNIVVSIGDKCNGAD